MKLKLNETIKNLKGEPVKNGEETLTVGACLSEIVLAPHEKQDGFRPLKAYDLAKKFVSQKECEIDTADFVQLKKVVEENKSYIPLVTAQILLVLEAVKEAK